MDRHRAPLYWICDGDGAEVQRALSYKIYAQLGISAFLGSGIQWPEFNCAIKSGITKSSTDLQRDAANEIGFLYLNKNFKKIGKKLILQRLNDCVDECECSWQQSFKNGITYSINECPETGFVVTIKFKQNSPQEVAAFVDDLFKTENNQWDEGMTSYSPSIGEVGCSYEIQQEKDFVVLKYYCGC